MVTRLSITVLATLMANVLNVNLVVSKELVCPEYCDCQFFQNHWVTDCSEKYLLNIPYEELDINVSVLIMRGNFLRSMKPFYAYKLMSLQLSENLLSKIEKNAFIGLDNLLVLDLSFNQINVIDPSAFV